jgi:L-iditol 2-dehydrogenase
MSGDIPASYRVAVMDAVDTTRVEQRPMPPLERAQVLVRIASVGVCGSDLHWYHDGRIGDTRVEAPLVLGHEASGRIVAVGPDVSTDRLGQRVALEPGIPCRTCAECLAGRYNLCASVRFFATPPIDGAFAEYVVIDETFAHPVPDTLSDDEAALIEPLSVAVWAARKAAVTAGDRVLVTGAGPIGLLAIQVARVFGATTVTASDVAPARLALAGAVGADTMHSPLDGAVEPGAYDVLLECSGAPAAISAGIRALAPAGRAVLVGMSASREVAIPLDAIQGREIVLTGTFRYANVYPTAIALAASGRVDLARLVTSHHGLDDVHGALSISSVDPDSIKAMVTPHAPSERHPV